MFLLDSMPHLLTFTVVYLKNIIYQERDAMDDDPLAFFISSEKSGWVSLDLSIPDKLYNW